MKKIGILIAVLMLLMSLAVHAESAGDGDVISHFFVGTGLMLELTLDNTETNLSETLSVTPVAGQGLPVTVIAAVVESESSNASSGEGGTSGDVGTGEGSSGEVGTAEGSSGQEGETALSNTFIQNAEITWDGIGVEVTVNATRENETENASAENASAENASAENAPAQDEHNAAAEDEQQGSLDQNDEDEALQLCCRVKALEPTTAGHPGTTIPNIASGHQVEVQGASNNYMPADDGVDLPVVQSGHPQGNPITLVAGHPIFS